MASDVSLGTTTGVFQAIGVQTAGGKNVPQGGKTAPATVALTPVGAASPQSGKTAPVSAAPSPAAPSKPSAAANDSTSPAAKNAASLPSDPQTLADQVNKFLNETGRSDQFRVDPSSADYIQQINPSSGAVIAEYLVSEFPALARSIGASGLLIDDTA
jgi:hypothetical protein